MQSRSNYYEILGVSRQATSAEIKKAFRRLATQYHPDVNPGNKAAEEKFKQINEAYRVLIDDQQRAQYDAEYRQNKGFWNASNGYKRNPSVGAGSNPRTVVEQLRQRSTEPIRSSEAAAYRPGTTKTIRQPPRTTAKNIEASLTLPLEKAYQGGKERIRLEDGRSLEIDLPAGMFDGQKIRLKGQGINGGDLYLEVIIAPHPLFELQGSDIYCQIPITPTEAILGGAVEVPTIDGLVKMSLPEGVNSGQRLRLANKGYPDSQGNRGDQLVEIRIVVPKTISESERELYQQIKALETFNPRQHLIN